LKNSGKCGIIKSEIKNKKQGGLQMQTKLTKTIALLVIFTLTFTYTVILAELAGEVQAASKELIAQNEKTNNANVQFNSHLGNGSHETEYYIGEDSQLYVNIKVTEGYLKNAVIEFSNTNFAIITEKLENEHIQEVQANKVFLREIAEGSNIEIAIPIAITSQETVAIDHFAKETKTKLQATYVNRDGKEKAVEKEILNQINWKTKDLEVQASQTITKYLPYEIAGKKGILLQTMVNSSIQENKTAINQTQIEIQAPTIAGKAPTRVKVTANSMGATNGSKTGIEFAAQNYSYNEETKTITIQTNNKENEIAWQKAQDQYIINMLYETEEAYNQIGKETELIIEGTVKVTPYTQETIEKSISGKVTLKEKVGEFANAQIETQGEISKAYIYANYNKTENKLETPYTVQYKIGSGDLELTDSLEINLKNSTYLQKQEEEILQTVGNLSTIKTIHVDKTMFQTYLGEEGKIEIYQNGKIVGTIQKPELKEDEPEPEEYTFDCTTLEVAEGLTLKTSKLQKEGNLYIQVEKAIKAEIGIEKQTAKEINQIEESILVNSKKEETIGATQEIKALATLTETSSKSELQLSTNTLSTVVTNQNIELKAILEADTLDDTLYKDPTLKIAMPNQVEAVEIQSAEILFTNELQNLEVGYNNETKTINISLKGIQTEYNLGAMIKGPTIRILANIKTKTLIPSSTENIIMQVTNQEDETTQEIGVPINIIAPTGLVAINQIEGYSEAEPAVQSVTGSENTGTLDIYAPAKTATIKGTIINNLSADATDVKILGRVPFEGNKKIDSEEPLGTNLTTNMASGISVNGIDATIYYSENAEATKELEEPTNQWTTEPQTLSNVKSYLIVAEEEQVEKASTLDFSYQVTVPENLPHNKDAYTTYKAYYNSQSELGTMAESVEAPLVGVSTKTGPELSTTLTSTMPETRKIHDSEQVRCFIEVKNTGSVDAKNVKAKITNPLNTRFVRFEEGINAFEREFKEDNEQIRQHEKTIDVGEIKAGESKTVEFELEIYYVEDEAEVTENKPAGRWENVDHIDLNATITADELETGIQTNTMSYDLQEGSLKVTNYNSIYESFSRPAGELVTANYEIDNTTEETVSNTQLHYTLPEGTTVYELKVDGTKTENYKVEGNSLTVPIEPLVEGGKAVVSIRLRTSQDTPNKFSTQASVKAGTEEYVSNVRYVSVEKTQLELEQIELSDRYVREGEVFNLTYKLTNTGKIEATNIVIENELPAEITPQMDQLRNGKVRKDISRLLPGQTITVTIPVIARLASEADDEKEFQNKATMYADGFDQIETNTITYNVEYVRAVHDNFVSDGDVEDGNGTYKISGRIWLDANVDGQREDDEQTIGNVKILLLNKANNSIVKDQTTGAEKTLTTDATGTYLFSNLLPGEYLVAFLYDSANYEITAYQKEGVPSSRNSDGIAMNIGYNGERVRGAVTNTITITNSNARDIDLGLTNAQSFDLKLDKYITKVTRVNSAETKTYNYENEQLVKIDTLRRRLNESNIIVEYKIVVTNEGAIPGYAKKVVDYLPKDLKFSSELNTDWYAGNDGNVYSNKLANDEIKPGESREITLVLTKQMTENTLGASRNTAEIYETYNVLGKADIDSVPGNKSQNEDDTSSADLVLSIVTGKVATYTGIVIASIALIAFGAYEVKKHVLDKMAKI